MYCTKYDYVSIKEASKIYNCSEKEEMETIKGLEDGSILGKKVGNKWLVAIPAGHIYCNTTSRLNIDNIFKDGK